MAKRDKKNAEAEAAAETEDAIETRVEVETEVEVEVDLGAEETEATADEATDEADPGTGGEEAAAEGEEADKKFIGDYTAEQWEALAPAEKVAFMKEKAKAAAKKSSTRTPGRNKSGAPTIGGVACEAIRAGLTNDEVLTKVFEQFPNAKTSIASITWYRNSLKSGGENIPTSREIKAARAAKEQTDTEDAKDPVAGTTDAELNPSDEDMEAIAELNVEGELSQEELNELLA